MYILAQKCREREGAYSVKDEDEDQVLYIFQEEDDATRYALQLEDINNQKMKVIEVEDDVMIKTCEMHGHRYTIITHNDIVIPPQIPHDYI